ncbi:MAG TPA: condensation domain-containing protein, partial [Nevskiaceae bacterium]|nr:condensation domain-containing protein [Nevskiaceae bacterium]
MNADAALAPAKHDPFAGPPLSGRVPLTESQREIWLAAQMHSEAAVAYNEGLAISLHGELDVAALGAAVDQLVQRQPLLRAGVSPNGRWISVGEPRGGSLQHTPGDLESAEREEMARPFDLEQGPLMRFRLVTLAPQEHVLLMIAHHVMVDGWSYATLLQELGRLYTAQVEGGAAPLPEVQPFADYVEAERRFVESAEGQRHADYWLKQLE